MNLELQFTAVSAHLQACMILKVHSASMSFTAAHEIYLGSLFCIVAKLFEFRLLLRKAHNRRLALVAEAKRRHGIWKAYFSGKRAGLFQYGYAVLDGNVDASKISTEVFNALERSPSFSVEPMQTMFDLLMATFPGEEVVKEEENQK